MTEQKLYDLLNCGEGFTVEYKECINALSNSVFETVVSFSNRYGGYILLGVKEVNGKGVVVGVNKKSISDIKKNFITILNNQNKIYPSIFLSLEEFDIDGKTVLWVYVPISSQVEHCNKKIYDRNGDSDQDITNSIDLVHHLFNRKSNSYHERKIFPYATTKHLHMDMLNKIRLMATAKRHDHPWRDMDDMSLLRNAGLYEENLLTGEKGFNLACLLLLGKDDVIQSVCPGYCTDAIYRNEKVDRYDDRLIVETNLLDSYDMLMNFIAKHTDDKFFLVDNTNVSVRDYIAREVVSNILVHREFSSAFPAKVIIDSEKILTENWNRPQYPGVINPKSFTPYPKNPLIAKFFVNIGRADILGSGVRNLYKYVKMYCGGMPCLEEGDVFKTFVPLKFNCMEYADKYQLTHRQKLIYCYILENTNIKIDDICKNLNISRRTIQREIKEIKKFLYLDYDKKIQKWMF